MFKIMRKMSSNFVGGESCCVRGEASRNRKNFGNGWALSAARRMKLGGLLLALLCPAFASAQVTELWVARYHGSVDGGNDGAVAMALDSAGNVYVTGRSQGAGTGFDYATVAYDPKGNQLWVARYNGTGNGDDIVSGIAVDSETGHVYVTGQSGTVAYDFKGKQLWVATGGGRAIAMDSYTGNVYVTAESTTVAYDSNGNQLWVASDQPDDFHHCSVAFKAIAVDSTSGRVYVTGRIYCFGGYYIRFRTVAYDQTGTQLWASQPSFGGFTEEANSIALGSAGS